jgi:hypothetical protein
MNNLNKSETSNKQIQGLHDSEVDDIIYYENNSKEFS